MAAEVKGVDQNYLKVVGAAKEPYCLLGFVEYFLGKVEDLVGEVETFLIEEKDLEGEIEDLKVRVKQ